MLSRNPLTYIWYSNFRYVSVVACFLKRAPILDY
jgi:hypothetical protein